MYLHKKVVQNIWTKTTAAGFACECSEAATRGLMAIDSTPAVTVREKSRAMRKQTACRRRRIDATLHSNGISLDPS
jgi:hypothetical protein